MVVWMKQFHNFISAEISKSWNNWWHLIDFNAVKFELIVTCTWKIVKIKPNTRIHVKSNEKCFWAWVLPKMQKVIFHVSMAFRSLVPMGKKICLNRNKKKNKKQFKIICITTINRKLFISKTLVWQDRICSFFECLLNKSVEIESEANISLDWSLAIS